MHYIRMRSIDFSCAISFIVGGDALHISLQFFALKGAFSETFAEEILRFISTSVSAVACNWNDHFDIFVIFRKDSLKAVAQIEEIFTLRNFAL